MSELIKKEVMVPKELQEVLNCLKTIVNAVKLGLPVTEIVANAIPPFLVAVEGVQNVPTEIKEHMKASVDAGLLFGNEVTFLFLDKEEKIPELPLEEEE